MDEDETGTTPVPLSQLQQLAHRAFDADQKPLACCLFFLVEACMELKVEEMYCLMRAYRNGEIPLRDQETGTIIYGGRSAVSLEEVLGYQD